MYSRVAECFKDENLRLVFSFHPLLVGGNPFTTTSYYCLIAHLESKFGVHHAMGGTGALVKGMVDLVEGTGGSVRCNAEVDRIVVRDGRAAGVVLSDGEEIAADLVVSNAEPAWTYNRLLRDHPRHRWTDRKIKRARHSMGLLVWYFGTNRRFDDVLHHNMIMGPRYEGLLDDIFRKQILAKDFSLYLHRPTASDPSLAPPGCDAFYVLSPVPHLGSGINWAEQAEPYRAVLQTPPGEYAATGTGRIHRDLAHDHAAGFPRPLPVPVRLRLRDGAAAAAERVVPAAQPQRGSRRAVSRRRGHASWCRPAGSRVDCGGGRLDDSARCAVRARQGGQP